MAEDKPTQVYRIVDCDYCGLFPSKMGYAVISLVSEGEVDCLLELSPKALAALETAFANIQAALRKQGKLQ